MTLHDALKYQLESAGRQIDRALEGLSDEQWDAKVREDLMSPKDVVSHLTECYVAAQRHADGGEYEWGTYSPASDQPAALLDAMKSERAKAWSAILAKSDEAAFKAATDYIVLHDAYHVGQLAALRFAVTPDWDPYAIYS